jgi:hypothetical protein
VEKVEERVRKDYRWLVLIINNFSDEIIIDILKEARTMSQADDKYKE